ncbi:MAG: SpoIID/LytB domain-containing protein [Chloroflexi bacterium]|nr:MAG: SpoIID/LytB domain-containing protein [Chloroflexota bacterium]
MALAMLMPGAIVLARQDGETLLATYVVSAPASVGAGTTFVVPVTVTNTGTDTWKSTAPGLVNLSYHWYDASGATVVWDGARTPLGGDLPPTQQRTVQLAVTAPAQAGAYLFRVALVQEGVGWLPPSNPYSITAQPAYLTRFGAVTLPSIIAGGTYQVSVPVTNAGAAPWPALAAPGVAAVTLSYHWHDAASGNTIVWDGRRTPLSASVQPGATATVTATVAAPPSACQCALTFDLVREGVAWFASLGSATTRLLTTVAPVTYSAGFTSAALANAYFGETKTIQMTVINSGNQPWVASGPNPVDLSYHLLDGNGNAVIWDGPRIPLGGDMAVGASKQFTIGYSAPNTAGTYTLVVDLVREGVAWFQSLGAQPFRQSFSVTSGLSAGYGATTTPQQATIGATLQLTVVVDNYGARTWMPGAFALSYHIFDSGGSPVVWDGARGRLPSSVPPFTSVTVPISVALPSGTGGYRLEWDMVQEGVAWFSQLGVQRKQELFTIVPGVTFYGAGFGHSVGMSQYGANGWATGVTGLKLTGEQIVARYYPGTALQFVDAQRPTNRVLLSAPSSQGRYVCGDNRYFAGSLADLNSSGGIRVLNEGANNQEIARGGGGQNFQFIARGGVVEVWANWDTPRLVYSGAGPVSAVAIDPTQPIGFIQKAGTYRGSIRFTNLGGTLRVINVVTYDDYVRGVLPLEMPTSWHPEALKAQAYAARTYSYTAYKGTVRDYDVTDDQADQCYGGTRVEVPSSNTAVSATAGRVITYNGASIRAYFASSNGGYTLSDGCWMNNVVRSGSSWACSGGQAYLAPVPDPADRMVAAPVNPRASWTVTFTSDQVRSAVLRCGGPDIGQLQAVDVSNQVPAGVGHPISVRVYGSAASADLRADDFLRNCLGLRSTMVRLNPF